MKKIKEPKGKDERTLFVGNLPRDINAKRLKQIFQEFGPIATVRFRGAAPAKLNMPKKVAIFKREFSNVKDNIFAYIVYKSKESVEKALELNSTELDGHHIRVDHANNQQHDYTHTVFVGNLSFIVKEEELYEFFSECGKIKLIRIVRDKRTGVGKGFAFVTFESYDGLLLAVEKNGAQLNGREIRISKASPQDKQVRKNKDSPRKEKISSSKKIKKSKISESSESIQDNEINEGDEGNEASKASSKSSKKRKLKDENDYKGMTAKKSKMLKSKKTKGKLIKKIKLKNKKNKIAQILAE